MLLHFGYNLCLSMSAEEVKAALAQFASQQRARTNAWFFKTAKGNYGAGDKFIGVSVPNQRIVAQRYKDLPHPELAKLFASPWHEHRLTACLISVYQYQALKKRVEAQKATYDFYLKQLQGGGVNNWDMVDTSSPQIIGDYLLDKPRQLLYDLAESNDLWQQRAAIISTAAFIRQDDFGDTLAIAEMLLHHQHDLIHKAVGWMLREVGNRDRDVEEEFLGQHYKNMPRTMLRYAIEKFPDERRRIYLSGRA